MIKGMGSGRDMRYAWTTYATKSGCKLHPVRIEFDTPIPSVFRSRPPHSLSFTARYNHPQQAK